MSSPNAAILVAGGAGYIGAHVCKALAAAGYAPVLLDNFSAGRREMVAQWPCVEACISNVEAVRYAISTYGIRAAIDLAGSIEVGESMHDPLKYYVNNVARKIPFLRALHEGGVNALVFSSTAAVYGEPTITPIPESHALNPTNVYGTTKLLAEQLLAEAGRERGLRSIVLRYFNVAGASPDGDLGEAHEPETHLIPRACMASLGQTPPLEIFGDDYPTEDGTAIRDYIHVCDLAEAHVRAVIALLNNAPNGTYNLGAGKGVSVAEIIAWFGQNNHPIPHRFSPRRLGDPSCLVADNSRAIEALGWQPQHSAVETMMRSAYQWHASNPFTAKASS